MASIQSWLKYQQGFWRSCSDVMAKATFLIMTPVLFSASTNVSPRQATAELTHGSGRSKFSGIACSL
jgi:hypothetical protein